jgi:preprotein translocase subunit SecE
MKQLLAFLGESMEELTERVTWPERNQLISNSILVLVASLIFALLIGLFDGVFDNVMKLIYGVN